MTNLNKDLILDIGREYSLEPQQIFLKNGKGVWCYLSVRLDYDECFDLNDFEPEDRKDIGSKLESGDLVAAVVRVKASFHQNVGRDYLGGVLFDSPVSLGQLLDEIIKLHNMEENAADELADSLNKLAKEICA